MAPAVNGSFVVFVRAALSVLTFLLTTTTIITGYISMSEFRGNEQKQSKNAKQRSNFMFSTGSDYKKWLPNDGGWGWHVASAVSEWILAIVYCIFLLTFVPEFRLIHFEPPVVNVITRNDTIYQQRISI